MNRYYLHLETIRDRFLIANGVYPAESLKEALKDMLAHHELNELPADTELQFKNLGAPNGLVA